MMWFCCNKVISSTVNNIVDSILVISILRLAMMTVFYILFVTVVLLLYMGC